MEFLRRGAVRNFLSAGMTKSLQIEIREILKFRAKVGVSPSTLKVQGRASLSPLSPEVAVLTLDP